jgi:hypothetical protein
MMWRIVGSIGCTGESCRQERVPMSDEHPVEDSIERSIIERIQDFHDPRQE